MDIKFNTEELLVEVEASSTSRAFVVDQFSKVGLQFTASGVSSGNGVFTVKGTIDGQNWVALNMLVDNVTNSNAQGLTRVASKTLSSNSSVLVWLLEPALKAIRVEVVRTTDGKYSAVATAQG